MTNFQAPGCGEAVVSIAAQIYNARGAMRGLFRDQYAAKVKPYRQLLRGQRRVDKTTLMSAALKLLRTFQEEGREAIEVAMLLAAVADECEASS